MNVEIERLSFYPSPGRGTLRYAEHEPPHSGEPHFECGCTKNVDERPEGEPKGVQVLPQICFVHEGRFFRYEPSTGFWIYPEAGPYRADGPHAYFWLHGQNALQVEIVSKPWKVVDGEIERRKPVECFLTNLYRGNGVDASRFFNGHSPTRLDLSWVKPDTVWVHACTFGWEAAKEIQEEEAKMWSVVFDALTVARDVVTPTGDLGVVDLVSLRVRLEEDKALQGKLVGCASLLGRVISTLEETELFQVGSAMQELTQRQSSLD